ncbi:glutamine--tRNA ligase/YqeY domain fusion protein [Abyssisolibacter fermentans]|uniref:glutamine--tRNA ligase/YqeY domain fusion protein n=1 Tax=Abyssisolibacter fermentans TaxID=1766203 RepID=UPI0008378CAC|nr:glutamine--tRNA ligase/YqeY domain fusion protein [Abyssisolibacter fermentans]
MYDGIVNSNFIDKIVKKELEDGTIKKVITRFPPEPNGYLHIGSAYAINISYSLAKKYNGKFNLRFDDTNPVKEDIEYVKAIVEDFDWMGIDYGEHPYYGSDYTKQTYEYAKELIKKGKAYVCDLSPDEIREYRGTLTAVGKNSPYRERTIKENFELFELMKNGKFKEGEKVLRAKIDMSSSNIVLRDPVIFRILHKEHYRTGNKWCIYPMYDFAHPIQDYIEGVTHSLCSNEFINNRALYEWTLNNLDLEGNIPKQIEFGRMNLTGVVTSKRYLKKLVDSGILEGWDDPRLPTLKGLKRRGYTKEAIFDFLNEIGVPKSESTVDVSMLEHAIRQDLNNKVCGVMAVINPLKVIITNYDENKIEQLKAENNRNNDELGYRYMPLTREIYIERNDFSENPPKKYKRLVPGGEVRLKHGYFIKCNEIIKDEEGNITELHCTYDPETKSGTGFKGRKVKGTIHWVSASKGINSTIRLFEALFKEAPSMDRLLDTINPNSKKVVDNVIIEPAAIDLIKNGEKRFQFIRNGYFIIDDKLTTQDKMIFNEIVPLKSSF